MEVVTNPRGNLRFGFRNGQFHTEFRRFWEVGFVGPRRSSAKRVEGEISVELPIGMTQFLLQCQEIVQNPTFFAQMACSQPVTSQDDSSQRGAHSVRMQGAHALPEAPPAEHHAALRAPMQHHCPPCCVAWHFAAPMQHCVKGAFLDAGWLGQP